MRSYVPKRSWSRQRSMCLSSGVGVRLVAIFCLLSGMACGSARAADLSFTVGVTGWVNTWNSWFINHAYAAGPAGAGAIQISDTVNSSTRVTATPQFGVSYGDAFLSGSYLAKQTYALSGPLESLGASRSELDIKLGYYVFSGVAISLGYKELQQDYGAGTYRWTGPIIALLGSVPLGATDFALYGAYGYGVFRLRLPRGQADFVGDSTFDASYSVAEVGVAYAVPGVPALKALRLTLGYRFQLLTTKDYMLESLMGATPTDEHDITQGLTLGLSVTL